VNATKENGDELESKHVFERKQTGVQPQSGERVSVQTGRLEKYE